MVLEVVIRNKIFILYNKKEFVTIDLVMDSFTFYLKYFQ